MRFLIVDGHSMIFACADLASLQRSNGEAARNELVARLTAFQDATNERVVVVFDGRGAKTTSSMRKAGIQVIYSRSGQTADSVIERLVANYGTSHDLRVATNDRAEQMTASGFGAGIISIGQLMAEMEVAARELSQRIRKHNARRAPAQRRESPFDLL